MLKYTEHCDLCGKEIDNDKNGFCIELGYSRGGWGHRKDFTPPASMVICDGCFSTVEEKAKEFDKTITKLRQK